MMRASKKRERDLIRVAKQVFKPENMPEAGSSTTVSLTPVKSPAVIPSFVLFVALTAVYLLIVFSHVAIHPLQMGSGSHFILLADGWLHGHLDVEGTPPQLADFTQYHGHWYVAFPPLPAILLLPIVAIFHLSYQSLITLSFSIGMGVINIWLMRQVLLRFVQKQAPETQFVTVAWLLVFFAIGTELLYATMQGNVWYIAHVVATTFVLLYISETLGKQRAWLAGIFLGLASLSRSTTLFTFPFFLVWTFAQAKQAMPVGTDLSRPGSNPPPKGRDKSVPTRNRPSQENTSESVPLRVPWLLLARQWVIFGSVLAVFLVGMLLYNYARFGSLLDFGYNNMHVDPLVRGGLHKYRQFSIHFLRTNFRFMLLEPPKFLQKFPYVTFSPFGTSIFLTMPALFLAFLGFRRREQRWLAVALLAACILPALLLLLYFNTGWYQFGYRFALDFLPFLFLLAALGMKERPTWGTKLLIILSVLINVWGYIVFTYFKPPLLG